MERDVRCLAVGAVLALTALFGSVSSVAADPPAPGTLLIVAGTGPNGFSGDGGPASQAQLNSPIGLAFDPAGNLFIGGENPRVRKVSPEGIITTVVGGGNTPPRPVDGIPASEARLLDVDSLAFDGAGNLFLSGFYANQVWKVSPEGWITAIDQIQGPVGVAVDAAGNLFVADFFTSRVRKMTPEGVISTVAGGGRKLPRTADGGPATEAQLISPIGVAVDAAGNLFIVDGGNYRVRRVSPDGIITTVAGTGAVGSSGDGGPATQARLKGPYDVKVDAAGNLFISDRDDYRVRKVTPEGIITTVAGTGKGQLSGVGGPATSAGLRGPHGLAVDAAGNLFIADTAWWDQHIARGREPASEHVLVVVGVAAPGLVAGKPLPKP
jgi:sugar lactone lactonase YvrE